LYELTRAEHVTIRIVISMIWSVSIFMGAIALKLNADYRRHPPWGFFPAKTMGEREEGIYLLFLPIFLQFPPHISLNGLPIGDGEFIGAIPHSHSETNNI
jgi:hypothetical protein